MNRFDRAVQKAVQRNKRQVTYVRKLSPTYTPGGTVSSSSQNVQIDAARVSDRITTTSNGQYVIKDVNLYYVSASSINFEPKVDESITDASETFKITKVEKHFAGGELVLYILHC